MIGSFRLLFGNKRFEYDILLLRKITVLRGQSSTGKSKLFESLQAIDRLDEEAGWYDKSDLTVLTAGVGNWELVISRSQKDIIVVDEAPFMLTEKFTTLVNSSESYFILITRNDMQNIPYAASSIYYLKKERSSPVAKYTTIRSLKSALYSDFKVDVIVHEDSSESYSQRVIECSVGETVVPANGNRSLKRLLCEQPAGKNVLIIADNSAMGGCMAGVMLSAKTRARSNLGRTGLFLPECFEEIILKSGTITLTDFERSIVHNPIYHCDSSSDCATYEQLFTQLLYKISKALGIKYIKAESSSKKFNDFFTKEETLKQIGRYLKSYIDSGFQIDWKV